MKVIIILASVLLVVFMYKNPPRTATVQMEDGTITTASVSGIVGKINFNKTYPMFKGILGEGWVIGTGDELVHTEQVKIIELESAW